MSEVDAFDKLVESLNATNVLSKDYKNHITACALKMSEQAYDRGRELGRSERDDDVLAVEVAEVLYAQHRAQNLSRPTWEGQSPASRRTWVNHAKNKLQAVRTR